MNGIDHKSASNSSHGEGEDKHTPNKSLESQQAVNNGEVRTFPQSPVQFSWDIAINFFDMKAKSRLGKASMFFLNDTTEIEDQEYLKRVTTEICREFGLELLDMFAEMILPLGLGTLQTVVKDTFKPVSKVAHRKTIVWIEDDHWKNPDLSIVEPLVRSFLLKKTDLFLIAPLKYFDKDILITMLKALATNSGEIRTGSEGFDKAFTALLKFGFLLALRSSTCPVILLHFNQKLAEKVDAFTMLDLAESEGHTTKYFKNTVLDSGKNVVISRFVEKILTTDSPNNKVEAINKNA